MRHPQRTFTPEFKQEAVRLLETSGKSGITIAKDLGISDTVLYGSPAGLLWRLAETTPAHMV